MRQKIDCFLACASLDDLNEEIARLGNSRTIQNIYLLTADADEDAYDAPEGCALLEVDWPTSSDTIRKIAATATAEYVLLLTKPTRLSIGQTALERMLRVACDSNAAMVYSDHYSLEAGELKQHPVIDYQKGSVRDDFDFGSVVMVRGSLLRTFAEERQHSTFNYAGWYEL